MNSYFRIDGLEFPVGDFRLGPVRLDLDRTDYLALLGPTGCGKTTLIKCIIGALGRIPGKIFLGGRDIGLLPPNKRKVGYVAQVGDLFAHLTVGRNISFGLRYLGLSSQERRERLKRYLGLFGLEKKENQPAATLSGGESKKVALARSLIVEPDLLLLDEPLGMLDHNERKEMIDVLEMIHLELQTTTVHVTHDRYEAWSIARVCAVMNEGKVLEKGSVAELFRTPSTRFVAEFLGGVNIFRAGQAPLGSGRASGWIMLRPEQISVVPQGQECSASGTVETVKDFGEYIEISVILEGSSKLTVHSSIEKAEDIAAGQRIGLRWPESAVHVLSDE